MVNGSLQPAQAALPLCVDLDGTLVRGDTLHEQLVRLALHRPHLLPSALASLPRGRAAFKRRLAELAPIDPRGLAYQEDLIEFLRQQRAAGRPVVLATAADASVARAVADHLGLFDGVLASEGGTNLKGAAKGARLVERFGAAGFAYAGDSRADLAVWDKAGEAILVNAAPALARRVEGKGPPVTHRFGGGGRGRLASLVKGMRVYQWVKNALVFAPLLLAHAAGQPGVLVAALVAFVAFSATASAIYLINDLFDLDADRAHPRKRRRPFASGDLPLTYGLAGPVLLSAGLATAWVGLSFGTFVVLSIYVVVTTAYSAFLKTRPLVDVFTLAGLYTIRVLAGGVATRVHVSIWLLGFSLFVFLSLAFLKRSSELLAARGAGATPSARRGYFLGDDQLLQGMGVAASFTAALVLSLYLGSDAARAQYRSPMWLWLVVPLVLFALCRLWLVAARGQMTDDPIVYALKDRMSWLVFALVFAVFLVATYLPAPGWL